MESGFSGLDRRLLVVLVVGSIIIVSGFAYIYLEGTRIPERNLIGVISVDGPILTVEGTELVTRAINEAIHNSSIKGVVVKIDSPGGFAHLVEQIYLDVLELKRYKPVVASLVTALSGGYYIAVAADLIYTHPSSMVGNVGVIGVAPDPHQPSERSVETGPYKVTGFSRVLFPLNISNALENFAGAVTDGRGTRLKVSPTALKRGSIYMGSEAISVGLAEEVGSVQRAAERAAMEAGIEAYTVVDIMAEVKADGLTTLHENATQIPWRELTLATLNTLNPPPAIYYLYLPVAAYQFGDDTSIPGDGLDGEVNYTKGQLVIDLSHGNRIPQETFHLLSAELAMRGVITGYADTREELESSLEAAACLIVAAPTEPYDREEFQVVNEFVEKGRILLMLYDPAAEFNDAQAPLRPINSLANRWGLTFAQGFLYHEDDHYGLYRNIYVRSFRNTSLTQNLESLVLFTATHLHSTDSDAAWTLSDAYSSSAERQGRYAPITIIDKGNGTTAAFGDMTFLTEPYAYLEDNYRLISNLVSAISEIRVPIVEPEEPEHNITEPVLPVGTVKRFVETVNGEESDLNWTRIAENQTRVERPDMTTLYNLDEEGGLLSWESDGYRQVYDEPLPDIPYPLIDGKAWAYRVGYTLTMDDLDLRGEIEGHGEVVGFEAVLAGDSVEYWCAKVSISETDLLMRIDDNLTIVVSELIWVSQEAGLVRSESLVIYYLDDLLVLEEDRSLLLVSIEKGKD
ncbi:MAG: S49 family peptidase [Candidatus Bathyarchaeota archaeon]|nr:MAG: S49 family peptidase [Candidatus Bathyarchaeota archaeon]